MLDWLRREIKVPNNALLKLQRNYAGLHAMQQQPSLAVAKANVAAMKELLHMRDAQCASNVASVLGELNLHASHAFQVTHCRVSRRTKVPRGLAVAHLNAHATHVHGGLCSCCLRHGLAEQ